MKRSLPTNIECYRKKLENTMEDILDMPSNIFIIVSGKKMEENGSRL